MIFTLLCILFLLIPSGAWFFLVRKKRMHLATASAIALVLGSVAFFGAFLLEEKKEKEALYAFDTNGDRMFSDEEMTPEARAAMDRWTLDAGNAFIPIVAVLVSSFWVIANFTTFYILSLSSKADQGDGFNSVTSLRDSNP